MFKQLQHFFNDLIQPNLDTADPQMRGHGVQLATAALLVEMARADFDVSEEERLRVRDLLTRHFTLDAREARELLDLGELEARNSTSLFQFTHLIDKHLSVEEKANIVTMLWEVAYIDGRLDKYEEYLLRKLSDLLHISHKQMLQLKYQVMARMGINPD